MAERTDVSTSMSHLSSVVAMTYRATEKTEENKQLEKYLINEIKTELAELASLRQDQHASADRQVTATTPSGQLGSQTAVFTDEKRDEPIKNELRWSKRTSKKSLQKFGGGLIYINFIEAIARACERSHNCHLDGPLAKT
ncbi:hypothetical protein KXD40_004977 [Peronospora effusa]|nr:hypothetical protein KXD40_004977 [Peronospora effusa]